MNSRRQAAFAVARWIASGEHPSDILPDGPDRAFVQDLVYMTVRRFRPLRTVLGKLVRTWPKGELEALLLVGGAQILYMPEVPDFAAVNETVAAAKASSAPSVPSVVNGVLRNLIRRRAEFEAYLAAAPLAERESYPNALVRRWIGRYGAERAEKLAKWHNEPAETWLAYPPGSLPDCDSGYVRLPRGRRIGDVPGFAEGAFIVQDPATALAVELMDVRPGLKVLDFCAAPGGKTAQIAWRMGLPGGLAGGDAQTRLVAREKNPARLRRLQENMERLRLGRVETVLEVPSAEDGGKALFDRVLADVPCTNTGVLRRRVDARWRWNTERLEEMRHLQLSILSEAAEHVAPGGTLVYSTCSNEPEENGGCVEAFLAAHPGFRETGRRESVPFETGHDGAFACRFCRIGRPPRMA